MENRKTRSLIVTFLLIFSFIQIGIFAISIRMTDFIRNETTSPTILSYLGTMNPYIIFGLVLSVISVFLTIFFFFFNKYESINNTIQEKHCSNCGSKVGNAKFCPECGSKAV